MTVSDVDELHPAVMPARVLVLTEDEQSILLDALHGLHMTREVQGIGDAHLVARLRERISVGETYLNATDELVRTTMRKRQLEGAARRANVAIAAAEETVIDEFIAGEISGAKHAATGASLSMTSKVWIKVCRAGEKATPDEKAAAAEALKRAGLGAFVAENFNSNTVSAHFRELVNAYRDEQRALPEHERDVARDVASFLPPELHGYVDLTDDPAISVRL